MFGGAALDRAGNPSNQDEVTAEDYIAPTLTVTLATAVLDRPVLRQHQRVHGHHQLRRGAPPYASDGLVRRARRRQRVGRREEDGRRWAARSAATAWPAWAARTTPGQQTFRTNDVGNDDGAYAVIVIGEDDRDNVGSTPGWANKRTDRAADKRTQRTTRAQGQPRGARGRKPAGGDRHEREHRRPWLRTQPRV